jgi:hypothetical protein
MGITKFTPQKPHINYQFGITNTLANWHSRIKIELMKKNKTRLGLVKTTIRVLRDIELTVVQGGGGTTTKPSNNPLACLVGPGGGEKL